MENASLGDILSPITKENASKMCMTKVESTQVKYSIPIEVNDSDMQLIKRIKEKMGMPDACRALRLWLPNVNLKQALDIVKGL